MSLYADQKKKIEYYSSRIIQDFARKGIYPDDRRISSQIANINTMSSILQYIEVGRNESFDTSKFNEDMLRIWQDLKILYELAYEITVKDYEELQLWCETYLSELQNMASTYRYKTSLELNSTYLGTTIFHQSSGFNVINNNGTVKINLGSIKTEEQAKLACIFNCDEVQQRNVIFTFKDQEGLLSNCSPYDYNHDFFLVPGQLKKNTYNVTLSGENVRTSFVCTPSSLDGKLSYNNKYKLYGGEGYVSFNYLSKVYTKKVPGIPVELTNGGIAVFYILDGTYATFEFSTTPRSKNFEGLKISDMKHCHKVVIEHDSYLSFDFATDGTIYATCQDGRITDGELIYPAADKISDILIEEYSVGDTVKYDVSVLVSPVRSGNIPVINAIAIKQLSALETIS